MPVETETVTLRADSPASTGTPEADAVDYGEGGRPASTSKPLSDNGDGDPEGREPKPKHRFDWVRACAFGLLPSVALLLAVGAGFLKWQDLSARDTDAARIQTVLVAKEGAVALLSYQADTVDRDLSAARDRLTGAFRDSYSSLTNDVVMPGAKQRRISAVATVPAAASVSVNSNHAVVMLFVNQRITVGNDAPSDTASAVKVTMDHIDGQWLISAFDPI